MPIGDQPLARHAIVLALAGLFIASAAAAQTITVRVVEEGSRQPVAGAMISVFGRADTALLSRFTDDSGIVTLRMPEAAQYRALARAIGYRPEEKMVTATMRGTVALLITLARQQMLLHPVVVETDLVCGDITGDGTDVFRVWDNIRTALEANRLTESQGLLRMEIETYDRDLSLGLVEQSKRLRRKEVATRQPFSAALPSDLESGGYVKSVGGETTYFAPEAKTLLSDDFANSHCFSIGKGSGEETGAIGLAFTPKSSVLRANIAGVLWVDTATLGLTHLDFQYVNVPSTISLHGVGGRVEFKRLGGGPWFIAHWYIRTPRIGRLVTRFSAQSLARDTLLGLRETGATARVLTAGKNAVVTLAPLQETDSMPVVARRDSSSVSCADSSSKMKTTVFGSVRDANGIPLAGAKLVLSWNRVRLDRAGNRVNAQNQGQLIEIEPDGQGDFVICGLPVDVNYRIELTRAGISLDTRHITAENKPRKLEVNFTPVPRIRTAPALVGTVSTADASPSPISDAEITLSNKTTRTDSSGRFVLTAIPLGTHIARARRVGYFEQQKKVTIDDDTVRVSFALSRLAPLLDTVRVKAVHVQPGMELFEDRRVHGFGSYITRDQLEKQKDRPLSEIFARLPGIRVVRIAGGDAAIAGTRGGDALGTQPKGGDAMDRLRGAPRACYSQVFIDGVRVFAPGPNVPLFSINMLSPSGIEGIEYYRGPAETPAQYSTTESECGTVLIWSRKGDPSAQK